MSNLLFRITKFWESGWVSLAQKLWKNSCNSGCNGGGVCNMELAQCRCSVGFTGVWDFYLPPSMCLIVSQANEWHVRMCCASSFNSLNQRLLRLWRYIASLTPLFVYHLVVAGPGCKTEVARECNKDVTTEEPYGSWRVSICPGQCDKRTSHCLCGNTSKYPDRPLAEACGFRLK